MTKDEIVKKIKSGLTGDNKKDIKYLVSTLEANIKSSLGVIIAFECSKLIYDLIEEEKKESYKQGLILDIVNNSPVLLKQMSLASDKGDYETANEIIHYLVDLIEEFNIEEIYPSINYREFNGAFEIIIDLFKRDENYHSYKELPLPLSMIFYQYGNLLLEEGKPREAIKYLKKAISYSPKTALFYIELGEAYKAIHELDKAFDAALKALKITYSNEEIAHSYRSLGYVLVEKGFLEEGLTLYRLSLDFDENEKALKEINYILKIANKNFELVDFDKMQEILDKYHIPLGADSDIVSLAYTFAKEKLSDGRYDEAKYFAKIGYELTDLEEFKEILDNVDSKT